MSYLDALELELAGYVQQGKTKRAEQVRAEIARVSGAAQERGATVAKSEAPRKRAARKVDHA